MVTHARIVFVNSGNHLTDTTGHDCRYRTADGHPLLPGYWYVVSWPEDIEEPLFDAHARYGGPYDSEASAKDSLANHARPSASAATAVACASDPSELEDALYFPDWHCAQ